MKLVFAGTPEFSVAALDALHAAGHDIVAVYTQPDRPAGRGQKLTPSPVAQRAAALGLPTFKPEKLRGNEPAIGGLRKLAPDLMIVVAYGLILPQAVLDVPRLGCFNIHASLLPRWRGAAPIQRAILAGDTVSGVTIMQMDAGLDTGAMLLRDEVAITPTTTAYQLHDQLQAMGARLIVDAVAQAEAGQLQAVPQPADGATYAHKFDKAEARLDWARPAIELDRVVRAFNPAPVAWTELGGERVRVFAALPAADSVDATGALPGTILAADADGIAVATGEGRLLLQALQWAGGRVTDAEQAARGRTLIGARFQ
ncbi:methionyl-tRNA formyltransferase [Hydrocarboniphaga daqingensis]|uniref:Methionyl-tRNA formyltransferase n=1 Tax=Hydrocarboniphaga daqingensis TaxID=490188 RepID=A0A1M5LHE8_9GAMM|nr:methionyl-tRNA formyltransferase [Hydrocarboniphaga daqingensis]SHG64552.1 methionyl-tRNA formyltransferase [Hydrocarboniphaga daqingensis]